MQFFHSAWDIHFRMGIGHPLQMTLLVAFLINLSICLDEGLSVVLIRTVCLNGQTLVCGTFLLV